MHRVDEEIPDAVITQAEREKLVGLAVWIGVVFVMFAGSVLLLL